jgi:hypothetical protein
MRTPGAALRVALGERHQDQIAKVEEAAGGRGQLARRLVSLPLVGALPKKGTAGRKRYDNEMRSLQRYSKEEGQTRTPDRATLRNLRRRAGLPAPSTLRRQLRKAGAAVATIAGIFEINDSDDERYRVFGPLSVPTAGWLSSATGDGYDDAAQQFLGAVSEVIGTISVGCPRDSEQVDYFRFSAPE